MEFKLEYLADDELKVFYLTKDTVVIGKLPENDIELEGQHRVPAALPPAAHRQELQAADMNSTNGCYVNGRRVQAKTLEVGDKITIGRTIAQLPGRGPQGKLPRHRRPEDLAGGAAGGAAAGGKEAEAARARNRSFLASLTALGKSLITSQDIDESFHKLGDLIFQFVAPRENIHFLLRREAERRPAQVHLFHAGTAGGHRQHLQDHRPESHP